MQNTEFINAQAKQQFETDGSLFIKFATDGKLVQILCHITL